MPRLLRITSQPVEQFGRGKLASRLILWPFPSIDWAMQSPVSRRNFLKKSLQAGAAVSGLGLLGNRAKAIEPFKRSGSPRFQLSLAAYSFRDFFKSKDADGKLDLFQFIDFCAQHGCEGAELTSYYFPKDAGPDYFTQIRRHAFLRGVNVSGTAVGNNFALPKGDKLAAQIRDVKRWIDNAALFGAPHIRVFAGPVPKDISETDARKNCIEALEECCEHAGGHGIFLGLENHGGIVAQADGLLEIVRAVKSPWLGVNLDTGNFHTKDPYGDLARCAPYAVNVQFKVAVRESGQAKQDADFPRLFEMLREAKYQGYVVLEYEAKEDPWTAVPALLKEMKQLILARS